MTNFHLPLPEPTNESLRALAKKIGKPATTLARELVEEGLRELQRKQIEAEIRAFADAEAGGPWDLDPLLEAAGLEAISEANNEEG